MSLRRVCVIACVLLYALYAVDALASCGNGVLDAGETCDPVLVTCCNSTCTGTHDVTAVQMDTATCRGKNFAQLNPYLTDSTYTYEWLFVQLPGGASPIVSTPRAQSTQITFNANGFYRVTVKITTPFCGIYYASEKSFTISDCCGNGIIDQYEECDYGIEDNGCCDKTSCTFVPNGVECPGTINDQCTQSLTCNGQGECLSVEDKPFNLVPLQSQTVQDTLCSQDIRLIPFQSGFNDPLDSTPGSYYWNVVTLAQWPTQHRIINASGTVPGPTGIVMFTIKMLGGGYVFTRLDVSDPCGLTFSLYYNVTRTCCGNMVLNTGEACDDGNQLNGDYCSSDCSQVTGECGDAIVQTNELCDYNANACCGPTCQSILPSNTLCRASHGDCDVAEYCTGMSADCPVDSFRPSNFTCRNALGSCDSPETCSGFDPRCPNQNSPFPSSVLCRNSVGVCDKPTYCDGISYGCPAKEYSNTTCRRASTPCDEEEVCQFGNSDCPADEFKSNTTVCAIDGTPCVNAVCSGLDDVCIVSGLPDLCEVDGPLTPVPVNLSVCLNVTCQSQVCIPDVINGTCFINGACYMDGDNNLGNPCMFCDAIANPTDWSTHDDETPCLTTTLTGACSATFDMCISGVCIDQYKAQGTSCRPVAGLCDVAEVCTGTSDLCPQDVFRNSSFVCHVAADVCDVQETCSGFSPFCPEDRVQPASTICRHKQGPCDIPEVCDGVHVSCPSDSFLTADTMCRPPLGACDSPEYCTGTDPLCPLDEHYDNETACRQSAGPCDKTEYCTGTGINCPPDEYADSTYICRPSEGSCDRQETCTGNSIHCPIDQVYPSGTMCRAAQGECDVSETCDGRNKRCPDDVLRPSTFECRPSEGPCDRAEKCDGVTPGCPPNTFYSSMFICRLQEGPCHNPAFCIFGNASCPAESFKDNTTVCRPAAGDCDIEELCTGTQKACPPDVKKDAGELCRAANGVCDKEERCNGVNAACPQDIFEPSTTICRESADPICDPPEMCTGRSATCPTNGFTANTVPCRYPVDKCDAIEYCDGQGACAPDAYLNSSHVCHVKRNQCDFDFNCTGSSVTCPYDSHATDGISCEVDGKPCSTDQCSNGVCVTTSQSCSCSSNSQCTSPHECIIGTCVSGQCQSAVALGTCFIDGQCLAANDVNPRNPCQICKPSLTQLLWIPRPAGTTCSTDSPVGECSAQDTCNNNGVCVDRYKTGDVCRPAVSNCDVEEVCEADNDYCPPDQYAPSTVKCRPRDGACDVSEYCSGSHAYCPTDEFATPSRICREAVSACDFAERCTGESRDCPEDVFMPRGTVCRSATDSCDKEEKCDGDSAYCPADTVQDNNWICRPSRDLCDKPEKCTGNSKSCPSDSLWPAGTICRPAYELCDQEETCDGTNAGCPPDLFAPTTKMCRPIAGPCDVAEFCTNTSASCPVDRVFREGVVCRMARDLCDVAETCNGESKNCPRDRYHNSSHVCRPAKNKCDVQELCTGDDITCPMDVKRANGYSCADYSFCNGDEVCNDGECVPATESRSCARPDLCTLDICDETSDRCVHTDITGAGQACYSGPNGTVDVGICRAGVYVCDDITGELTCRGEVTPKLVEYCGNEKDDNCNGVVDENCHVGPCYTDQECEDSPIDRCHIGHCNENNKCAYHLLPGFCYIDDRCYEFNEYQRHNPCRRCYPDIAVHEWTENNNANVSDFNVCNGGEFCRDGKVHVDPPPLDCSYLDTPCTVGLCNVFEGCYREIIPNGNPCQIPGARCSVDFECRDGACVCDGILDIDSSHTVLIVGLTVGIGGLAMLFLFSLWIYGMYEGATEDTKAL